MDRRKQNIYWITSLVILTLLTVFINWQNNRSHEDINDSRFTLEPNTVITTVQLKSKNKILNFDYRNKTWVVNDEFKMDPNMRDAFFTVISSIRIKRPVGINQKDSIASYLTENGIDVKILNKENLLLEYIVGGDEIRSISYFMDPEKKIPYIVTLPGYDSFVAGIYSVPELDWKDRFVLELDWSNLKKVELDYPQNPENNFKIEYKEDFFYLNHETDPLDSATVFDYIGELTNLQASRFLEINTNSSYDSLLKTTPLANLTLSLIGKDDQTLSIFPILKGDRHQIGSFGEKEIVEFNPRALTTVLKRKKDW